MAETVEFETLATYGLKEKAAAQEIAKLLKEHKVSFVDAKSMSRLFTHSSDSMVFEPPLHFPRFEPLYARLGQFSFAGTGCRIERTSVIGRHCSFGWDLIMGRPFHPTMYMSTSKVFYADAGSTLSGPDFENFTQIAKKSRHAARLKWMAIEQERHPLIEVGHDVWIGDRAVVMQGVKIGTGAVVAAGAVVTKDVPPYAIVGGVPAKVIGSRFAPEIVERLLATAWWEMPLPALAEVPFHDITAAVKALDEIHAAGPGPLIQTEIRIDVGAESLSINRAVVRHGAPAAPVAVDPAVVAAQAPAPVVVVSAPAAPPPASAKPAAPAKPPVPAKPSPAGKIAASPAKPAAAATPPAPVAAEAPVAPAVAVPAEVPEKPAAAEKSPAPAPAKAAAQPVAEASPAPAKKRLAPKSRAEQPAEDAVARS